MIARRFVYSVIAVAVAVEAGTAAADPKVEAQAHIDKATTLHGEGKLADALKELKDAYVLDPRPELLFAIGQIHVLLGECRDAITYYERFLTTRPDRDATAVTKQAIDTCKKNPPPVKVEPKIAPKIAPKVEPKIVSKPAPTPEAPAPWYSDTIADVLLGSGVAVGIAGGALYGKARSDRSKADDVSSFQRYSDLLDHAKRERTIAIALGAGGGALVIGGVIRLLTHDRSSHGIAIAPASGGAAVTWMRGF